MMTINVHQIELTWYEITLAEISVDQPKRPRHCHQYSSYPDCSNGQLQFAVSKLGLVFQRMHDGDVALYGC